MKIQQKEYRYWCHHCKLQFAWHLGPGQDDIHCPECTNDFCQLMNSNHIHKLKYFQPFQKQPQKKKRVFRINKSAIPVHIHELHQILQQQNHQKQGIQINDEQLQQFVKVVGRDSECSVCRQDLKKGEKHLIFNCNHYFHKQCLVDWLKIKNSCPTCRKKMINK